MEAPAAASRRVPVLGRVADVREGEAAAVLWAFAYFFFLLAGYYLLRPIREEMGIRGGVEKLHWVFSATFVVMLAAVPIYSAVVARVPRARAIPWVYRFFLLNLVAFFLLVRAGVAPAWVARVFFVWVSVYNLFVTSAFWSLMADVFSSGEGKRLFGFVAAGGSAGALAGSAAVAWLAAHVGIANLLLLSAATLEVAVRCVGRLVAWGAERGPAAAAGLGRAPRPDAGTGGSALAGITAIFRSPYLLGVAVQMLLFAIGSTFLYFQQARIVAHAIPDSADRARLFAAVDLGVNVAALATQALATGRIVGALGVGPALALVPALSIPGFAALALLPTVWTLGVLQAVRRAAHFALERPTREVLFTVVSREDKYKAKSFIDTFVYRGGDVVSGWLHAGLAGLGFSLAALSLSAIPFTAASVGVALWLGRRQRRLEEAAR
ncbi:NTP/NDP exchange transporter [Anaeromyxobacter oryzae]|uniref:MFS transporter n=1 Tax=Anaeromyxobacter oryzae TaxID=2918170 RepID=A0ABM7WQU6_9BACT|nr:MFS transporter [Anaeromyxobacter oryzae]BDG01839.1 MFS transporter [Anaeromyxobacter oryzae]